MKRSGMCVSVMGLFLGRRQARPPRAERPKVVRLIVTAS